MHVPSPRGDGFYISGALPHSLADADRDALISIDAEEWEAEYPRIVEHYRRYEDRLPTQLQVQLHALKRRLDAYGAKPAVR